MKAHALSAVALLLAAGPLRADPPGAAEPVTVVVLPPGAGDADLARLCEVRLLRVLDLSGTRVSDDGLRAVE